MAFVKIHRKITDWEWYTDANTYRLFTHLLYKANYKTNRWMGIDILPGQLVMGRKELARQLKLSEQEIRTSISKLKSTSEITIKSTNKYSIVTICKWEDYQVSAKDDQPTDQPTDQQSSNQQSTTLKEREEVKEEKNEGKRTKTPPSLSEIESYFSEKIIEKGLALNATKEAIKFQSFYDSKNWMVGKNKMTKWKSAVSGWIERDKTPKPEIKQPQLSTPTLSEFDFDSLNAQRMAALHPNQNKAIA